MPKYIVVENFQEVLRTCKNEADCQKAMAEDIVWLFKGKNGKRWFARKPVAFGLLVRPTSLPPEYKKQVIPAQIPAQEAPAPATV